MITMGKRFKKTMAMAMATAMAFSIPVLPVVQSEKAEAAKVTPAEATSVLDVTISEMEETATVTSIGDASDVVYYAITTQAKLDKGTYPSATAYEAVEVKGGAANIDLTWVNRKKEQVLCVATGSSVAEIKPVATTLKAQDTLVAAYTGAVEKEEGNVVGDSDNGYITLNTGTKKAPTPISAGAVEYRTTNSNWMPANYLDLAKYTAKGTTLQLRVAPNDETSTPAGKIVNLKVKAKTKAPNVTVNYNDKTVSVPAKVQFSTDKGESWSEASKAKAVNNMATYGWDGTEKTVYFRTAAAGTKAASKIKYVTIKEETSAFVALTAPESNASAPVTDNEKNAFEVRYKTAYLATSGLTFTNTTENIYQVALAKKTDLEGNTVGGTLTTGDVLIAASSSAIVAKANKKVTWTTVKAGTDAKAGTATIATSKVEKLAEDYVILYRICDTKGTTVNSEARIFAVPSTIQQGVDLLNSDNEVVTEVTVASATTGNNVVLTVLGSGLVATSPKYTVAAYSDEACTTKYTNLTAAIASGKLTVASKAKTVVGTYYVKVSVEGTSTVLKVVVE